MHFFTGVSGELYLEVRELLWYFEWRHLLQKCFSSEVPERVSDGCTPGAQRLPKQNICFEDLGFWCIPFWVLLLSFACFLNLSNLNYILSRTQGHSLSSNRGSVNKAFKFGYGSKALIIQLYFVIHLIKSDIFSFLPSPLPVPFQPCSLPWWRPRYTLRSLHPWAARVIVDVSLCS